jgi:hypothetical protein
LTEYRRTFNPPSPSKTPVLVRSVTYAGEPFHPVTPKRTITVPVSLLPLTNDTAIHNIKVIADTRWTMEAPKDAGLPQERHTPVYASEKGKTIERDLIAEHGYIKISSESFPEGQMNLKWCMDTVRRLVKEANVRAFYQPIPHPKKSNTFYNRTDHQVTRSPISLFQHGIKTPDSVRMVKVEAVTKRRRRESRSRTFQKNGSPKQLPSQRIRFGFAHTLIRHNLPFLARKFFYDWMQTNYSYESKKDGNMSAFKMLIHLIPRPSLPSLRL